MPSSFPNTARRVLGVPRSQPSFMTAISGGLWPMGSPKRSEPHKPVSDEIWPNASKKFAVRDASCTKASSFDLSFEEVQMDSWRVNPVFAETFSYTASHRSLLQKASNPPNPPDNGCFEDQFRRNCLSRMSRDRGRES